MCSILWNPHDKELVTSHGYSQNQLTVWKYPSLVKMAELTGLMLHSFQFLCLTKKERMPLS